MLSLPPALTQLDRVIVSGQSYGAGQGPDA
jgi:hypothetical protein